MLANHLLQELVSFAETGTLAKTADQLHLTQPAITQGLKKLEAEWGVQLFSRKPNRLILTETGKFAAQQAKKLLNQEDALIKEVITYDHNLRTIIVGGNAPGPLIVLRSLKQPNIEIRPDLIENDYEQLLFNRQITCLLLNQPIKEHYCQAIYLGTESMCVNIPTSNPLAKAKHLSFKDLHGQTILSPSWIGFWQQIYQTRIPHGKFIYQDQSSDYREILNYSRLLFFTTNVTPLAGDWSKLPGDRAVIPLTDKIAHQAFYACFLKQNQARLQPLITRLQDQWAKIDV